MNNNYYPGNPQGGTKTQKKEIFNQWQGIGILRSRSTDENEPIKFIPWQNGGGVINAYLKISEPIGTDENGNTKTSKISIPVSIKTNKNITAQQLQSIVSGTKVRVVGRLKLETYESRRTNTKKTSLVADVYVLEILEMPMQPVFNGYPNGSPQYGTPPYGYPPAPGYGQVPPQAPHPQYGYMAPPAQGYQIPPNYTGQAQPQMPQQYSQVPQQQPAPHWYKQPQDVNVDDLPPA